MPDSNPYAYGALGERWADGNPTSTDNLNKARLKTDANRWTLQQIVADPDNPEGGPIQSMPSGVYSGTDEDADVILRVDLDYLGHMWNLRRFRQLSRNTSWYDELGHMPTRLLIWINAAANKIVFYDRATMTEWIDFPTGGFIGGQTHNDIFFLDGMLYIADENIGMFRINFLMDRSEEWATSGYYVSINDISGRASSGLLFYNTSPAIVNDDINAVAAIRDPSGAVDVATGRPLHRVLVGTAGGLSLSDAGIQNFYDDAQARISLGLSAYPGGFGWNEQGAMDIAKIKSNPTGVSADAWNGDLSWWNAGSGAQDLPWGNAVVHTGSGILDRASIALEGDPVIVFGSDAGLAIAHANENSEADGLTFIVDDVANWPPYGGAVGMSLALEDVTELFGNDLTNNGGVTFVSGVVGNCANFVAASSQSLTDADVAAHIPNTGALSVGCWFRREVDSGGNEGLVSKYDVGDANDRVYLLYINSADVPSFVTITAGPSQVTSSAVAIALNTWYHLVGTYDGTTQRLYLNGVLIDSDAQSGALIDASEVFIVGAMSDTGVAEALFDGQIDQVFVMGKDLSAAEVAFLYQRGRRAQQSAVNTNDALDAADVDYVAVDPEGEFFAAGNQDVVVIFDKYVIPVLEDASPGGNIQTVEVWSSPGSDDPSYVLGTSTDIETVQQDIQLAERA